MNKAYITDYKKNCIFCYRPTTELHHLVYGGANRRISDDLGLVIPVCRECHNEIHKNGLCGKMSKYMGELLFELNQVADEEEIKDAREKFRGYFQKTYF